MRKMVCVLAAAVMGVGAAASVKADKVTLNDGEEFTGTLSSLDSGKMVFHSDIVGDVTIPIGKVRTFSTDKPIDIHLSDGTVIPRQVVAAGPGEVALAGGGVVAPQTISIDAIDQINPPLFTGSITVGGTVTRGNTDTETLAAGIKLGYRLKAEQLSFSGEYDYGQQKVAGVSTTSVDHWDLDAKYQHYFTKKFYGYIEGDAAKDRIAFLDLRFDPSAGVGYNWLDGEPLKFNTEGGIAWLYEKYTNDTPTVEDAALKLAYHLTYDFNDKVSLFHDVTYVPSLDRGSRFLLESDLGLHAKLNDKLFTELKAEWDYNSTPAIGALKNDFRYVVSVGYTL
jgi:putative salt-induced outer membrane protein YdiY